MDSAYVYMFHGINYESFYFTFTLLWTIFQNMQWVDIIAKYFNAVVKWMETNCCLENQYKNLLYVLDNGWQ